MIAAGDAAVVAEDSGTAVISSGSAALNKILSRPC
jgi:hypothetical protein